MQIENIFPAGKLWNEGGKDQAWLAPVNNVATVVATRTADSDWTLTTAGVAASNAAIPAAGAKVGATVSAAEATDAVIKTILTLAATPVTLTDVGGTGQWGAVKVYDFPAGNILILGATIDADITLTESWWADAATGEVGLGTTANADATTIATTRQDIVAVTSVAEMVDQAGPIDAQSVASLSMPNAGGTDVDCYLNIKIADSVDHMPDAVTNGNFTASATGWTVGTGWAYGTDKVDATTASGVLSQAIALVPGVSYSLAFTTTRSAGSVRASVGGTLGTARSTAATFTETIIAGSDGILSFTGTGFTGSVDTVSLIPLTGSGTIAGTITLSWINLGDS